LPTTWGFGKTIQTIALLASLYPAQKQPTLIVMPKTLLFNWENELKRFAPKLSFALYYGQTRGLKKSKLFILQAMGELRQIASIPEIKSDNKIISPKREILMEHVADAVAGKHKVLVFANYLHSLECVSLDMEAAGINHLFMTGATRDRSRVVEQFQDDDTCKALLMTLKTGGLGLIHFTRFQTMERLPGLLVGNLGFDSVHPLAYYVRQKALEACFYFKDSDRMLETILGTKTYGSWQQKANMVQVGYVLNSSHPGVIEFIEKMASDASPNVRVHVVKTVQGEKKTWAKILYRRLSYDTNPLVREACGTGTHNQDRVVAQNQFLAEKRDATIRYRAARKRKNSYNRTEMMISRHCDFPTREQVYELYLSYLVDLLDKKNMIKMPFRFLK
jgi:SNF2-related domain